MTIKLVSQLRSSLIKEASQVATCKDIHNWSVYRNANGNKTAKPVLLMTDDDSDDDALIE